MPAKFRSLRKPKGEDRCAFCGDRIRGEGVECYGKRFCQSWPADFYRPPPPWYRRLRWRKTMVTRVLVAAAVKSVCGNCLLERTGIVLGTALERGS